MDKSPEDGWAGPHAHRQRLGQQLVKHGEQAGAEDDLQMAGTSRELRLAFVGSEMPVKHLRKLPKDGLHVGLSVWSVQML